MKIDVAGKHGAERLFSHAREGGYRALSSVMGYMAATRCANPIILLGSSE